MHELELNIGKPKGKDIFDLIARKIESSVLQTSNYFLIEKYSVFENAILRNERLIQDLREVSEEENKYLISKCESQMELWFLIINEDFLDFDIITNAVKKFSSLGDFMEQRFSGQTKEMIDQKIYTNFHPNITELRAYAKEHFQSTNIFNIDNRRKGYRRKMMFEKKEFINTQIKDFALKCFKSKVISDIINSTDVEEKEFKYEWDVEIIVNTKDLKSISYLLWSISEGLEFIDGVNIELVDWGKGSFWVKFKLNIYNLLAKEEVKDVLEKSRKAAEAYYLDQHIGNAENTKLENRKIEEELKRLVSIELTKEFQKLDIELRQLNLLEKKEQIIAAQLQNQQRKIELINSLSEMIKNGIIKVDSDIQIKINDLLFASFKAGEFKIGNNLDKIEEKERRIELKENVNEEKIE